MHDGMASHLHIIHCQSPSANGHTWFTRRAQRPARIATNYSAAVCTSLHLFLASLQLNSAVFLGLSDPFTATFPPSPHIPQIPHSHCRLQPASR